VFLFSGNISQQQQRFLKGLRSECLMLQPLRFKRRSIPPQIFKTAEELDLGCGVGGGKDSKDIFKVGISNVAPL